MDKSFKRTQINADLTDIHGLLSVLIRSICVHPCSILYFSEVSNNKTQINFAKGTPAEKLFRI